MAETLRGSVYESPVRRLPHAQKRRSSENLSSGNPHFLVSVCLRVIDLDLKHRKTLLQFFSTCSSTFPSGKFGLQASINWRIAEQGSSPQCSLNRAWRPRSKNSALLLEWGISRSVVGPLAERVCAKFFPVPVRRAAIRRPSGRSFLRLGRRVDGSAASTERPFRARASRAAWSRAAYRPDRPLSWD